MEYKVRDTCAKVSNNKWLITEFADNAALNVNACVHFGFLDGFSAHAGDAHIMGCSSTR